MGKAVDFLIADEPGRALLTSMVACLFARSVYTNERLAQCLDAVGYPALAGSLADIAEHIRRLRWQTRIASGFDPETLTIPKRFLEVATWKGGIDGEYLRALEQEYGRRILQLAAGGDAAEDRPERRGS